MGEREVIFEGMDGDTFHDEVIRGDVVYVKTGVDEDGTFVVYPLLSGSSVWRKSLAH